MQSIQSGLTLPIDGAPATPVAAGTIIIASGANAGNGKISTAKAIKFLGVSQEATDAKGYAAVANQSGSVVDCIAGGTVAYGDPIMSDATGRGITGVPAEPGTTLTQFVGYAMTATTVGLTFKLLIQPWVAAV